MTTKHTPEPWVLNKWQGIEDARGMTIEVCGVALPTGRVPEDHTGHANAARIVACVNACAGINPDAVPDLLAALKDATALLDAIAKGYPDIAMDTRVTKARIRHRAAIAKAKGE